MEINPFKVSITFKQYITTVKPKIKTLSVLGSTYNMLVEPIKAHYYDDYYIIGYHTNDINTEIICSLRKANINNTFKNIFINANVINITVEVVLKTELKNINSVEQLNLFENEQSKD